MCKVLFGVFEEQGEYYEEIIKSGDVQLPEGRELWDVKNTNY